MTSPTPTPERKPCCPKCYGRQGTSAGGGVFCADSNCPCHTPESRLRELEEEAVDLMNDRRTGLRDSSDTNKTRYSLLGLIEDAYKLGLSQERELLVGAVEKLKKPPTRYDNKKWIEGYNKSLEHVVALLKSKN